MKHRDPNRKERVLRAIGFYFALYPQLPPTLRELCDLTGIKSTSVMDHYVQELAKEGKIIRYHGVSRGIVLAGQS